MPTLAEALAIAARHLHAGRLAPAEQIYRQILAVEPNQPEAWHLLGVVAHQAGNHQAAVECITRAVQLQATDAGYHNNLGEAYRALHKLPEAIACFRRALQLKPDLAATLNNLGNALNTAGQREEAAAALRRALQLDPHYAAAHTNLGLVLEEQGHLDEALACHRRAAELQPGFVEAQLNLGNALQEQGHLEEAVACYRHAIELQPDFAAAHYNLGNALREQGHRTAAAAAYRRSLELNSDDVGAWNNLGTILKDEGQPDEAAACYRRALQLSANFAQSHSNLGNVLRDQGRLAEAVACYRRALALEPDFVEAHLSLGMALYDQGLLDEALACARRALQLKPAYAFAHNNLGIALHAQGRFDEAAECFRRAVELKPDFAEPHWNRSMLDLLRADFRQGWPEYEWRWQAKQLLPRSFPQPAWQGEPLAGKTCLLHAEQGFGDTIQFVRYAPLLKRQGATVIVECQKPLLRLLARCPGIDRLVAHGDPLPAFDVHLPLLSVPRVLNTCLATIPAEIPYLSAEAELVDRWRHAMKDTGSFKIGINWRGRPGPGSWTRRNIPLEQFTTLAEIPNARLISLQKGAGPPEEQAVATRLSLWQSDGPLDENAAFTDTAAVMRNLDLVVTSDTAVPHLAGALGVPVWVALPFVPDWRWLLARTDSPWYPTMRLFRQPAPGDWTSVFQEIATELRRQVRAGRAPQ